MTEQQLLSKPRYIYEVAEFLQVDKRTLVNVLSSSANSPLPSGGARRLLFPHEVVRILNFFR